MFRVIVPNENIVVGAIESKTLFPDIILSVSLFKNMKAIPDFGQGEVHGIVLGIHSGEQISLTWRMLQGRN